MEDDTYEDLQQRLNDTEYSLERALDVLREIYDELDPGVGSLELIETLMQELGETL
jgi:hypothetical protein